MTFEEWYTELKKEVQNLPTVELREFYQGLVIDENAECWKEYYDDYTPAEALAEDITYI